ncbi:MAG TPA: ureidoglycolate lyase [Caldimonas sp.]|nr:ureidoglycolate lyase [Caldimonas sp.]HEX4235633.1 ureidoglycolate lyase [Caldimonas sp.]
MGELRARDAAGRRLVAVPLDAAAFRLFGDVIDRRSASSMTYPINGGSALRLHDLARIDASTRGGHPAISIVRASPQPLPFRLECMERHRRGSQAFIPLTAARWIIVVAPPGRAPRPDRLQAFVASAEQGVNYARGTWHHPLLAIDRAAEFLVVDRVSDDGEEDCDMCDMSGLGTWLARCTS